MKPKQWGGKRFKWRKTFHQKIEFYLFSSLLGPEKPPTAKMQRFPLHGEILWSENQLCEILFLDSAFDGLYFLMGLRLKYHDMYRFFCDFTQSIACMQTKRPSYRLVKRLRTFPFVQRPQRQRRQQCEQKTHFMDFSCRSGSQAMDLPYRSYLSKCIISWFKYRK